MTFSSPYSRHHPYPAVIKERTLLTGPTSSKKTYHISLQIPREKFQFKSGDTIALFPENHPKEVECILSTLKIDPQTPIEHPKHPGIFTAQDLLLKKLNITKINTACFKQIDPLSPLLDPNQKEALSQFLNTHSLLDILKLFPPHNQAIIPLLSPLLPRFYSIANSPLVCPDEIHLTLALPSYIAHGETRYGVASQFLCHIAQIGITPILIYPHPSEHFILPANPQTPIILIGPGTGIAPFRAFLQERALHPESGSNWLFFGERNRASDFYYEDFFSSLEAQKKLRLDLAFSRDTAEKIYVQHKLYEHKATIWKWLESGSHLYICGNADKMAKDVEATLHTIIQEEGNHSPESARLYLRALRTEKRYLLDVY